VGDVTGDRNTGLLKSDQVTTQPHRLVLSVGVAK
jgi:hypothetical protein